MTTSSQEKDLPRTIVEYCCGPNSLMGKNTNKTKNCRVVRLTETDDMTTGYGVRKALQAVDDNPMYCYGGRYHVRGAVHSKR